jgi:hypothetical protein
MRFTFLLNILLLQVLIAHPSHGQQNITPEEIIETWKKNQPCQNIDSVFRWDVHLQTRKTLDDLLSNRIDTLVVYSVSHPGYGRGDTDTCTTMYEVNSYFFWQKHGEYHLKKVHGQCESQQSQVDGEIIRFFVKNYQKIDEEFFMEAIYGVVKVGDRFRVKSHRVNHEPKYSILLVLADMYKFLNFSENDLIDKQSMFFDYNQTLTSFKLFTLINSRTEKVE